MTNASSDDAGLSSNIFAADLLHGCSSIATFLDVKPRRVYYLAERKLLPIGRLGGKLVARRSELMAALSNRRED